MVRIGLVTFFAFQLFFSEMYFEYYIVCSWLAFINMFTNLNLRSVILPFLIKLELKIKVGSFEVNFS